MVLCVLATDEEDEGDIALQIHFTLLQAFCCDNDINILRVSGVRRLDQLLGDDTGTEPRDLHCILVTVSPRPLWTLCTGPVTGWYRVCDGHFHVLQNPPMQQLQSSALKNISSFCEESRCRNQWVPSVQLQDR